MAWCFFQFYFLGLAHGISMIFERQTKINKTKNIFIKTVHKIVTLFSIILLWVLFRNGTKETIKIWLKMFGINYSKFTPFFQEITPMPLMFFYVDTKFFKLMIIGILFTVPFWRKIPFLKEKFVIVKIAKSICLVALLGICFSLLASNTYNPFIYFRF